MQTLVKNAIKKLYTEMDIILIFPMQKNTFSRAFRADMPLILYLRDAMSLSAYRSPQNCKMTCHRPSRSGLHRPVL